MNDDKSVVAAPAFAAAAAGTGTMGAYVAKHNIGLHKMNKAIDSQKATNRYNNLVKKLKPGDIFVLKYPRKDASGFVEAATEFKTPETLKKLKIDDRFKLSDTINGLYGKGYTHAGLYAGNRRTIEANPGEGVVSHRLSEAMKGNKVVFLRPKEHTPEGARKALAYAKSNIGKPYTKSNEVAKNTLKHLFTGIKAKGKNAKGQVCTSLVAESYPKEFGKQHMKHPLDAYKEGKLDIVAVYNKTRKKDFGRLESVPERLIHPMVKGLKYALPAAAAGYIGKKIYDHKKQERS